jgi:hypothetical protein
MVPSRCRVCAKPLEQPKFAGRKRQYCSKACKRRWQRRQQANAAKAAHTPAISSSSKPKQQADFAPHRREPERRPPEPISTPREKEEDRHLDWWQIERLGLGSGGYWVGSERPPWRSCQSLSGDGWEGELSL